MILGVNVAIYCYPLIPVLGSKLWAIVFGAPVFFHIQKDA